MAFNELYCAIEGGRGDGGTETTGGTWTQTEINTIIQQVTAIFNLRTDNKINTNSAGEVRIQQNQEVAIRSRELN